MRKTRMVRPEYGERFACIGSRCEDTCCNGWGVMLDEASYRKHTGLPAGPLRSIGDTAFDLVTGKDGQKQDPAHFAVIRMLPSGDCPFLSEERLCRIHSEYGEPYLFAVCATFPRIRHTIDGLLETELSLSCPEAARVVLLAPHLLPPANAPGYELTWDESATGQPLRSYFWQIRAFVIELIQNRNYSMWQRLFLLGVFSRRLEALVRGELDRNFPAMLDDFSGAVAARGLSMAMESVPAALPLQLEFVLRLIAQRLNGTYIRPTLRVVLDTFVEGIGHSREASIDSQAARYHSAHARFYAPFFQRHPHIFENYLINIVLRDRFPFGPALADPQATPEPARAFAMLALQFALIKGLLIGVAGARKRRFCSTDVVRTVAAAFRHFEHYPGFLREAHDLLSARGLDKPQGLTMLLRN